MSRWQLTFEIIRTLGILYEVRFQGPKKLGAAMERFWNAAAEHYIERSAVSANDIAVEFLEAVYNGAPEPGWLVEVENQA
jgi:hypothetical protein